MPTLMFKRHAYSDITLLIYNKIRARFVRQSRFSFGI